MIFQFLTLISLFIIWKVLSKSKSKLEPPSLSGKLPLIGHAYIFIGAVLWDVLKNICDKCMQNGGLMQFNLGPRIIYAVTDPDDCIKISNACLEKEKIYKFAKNFLGNGLITGDVSTWKVHRKLLNPAFNQHVLNSFIGTFNSQSRRLVDELHPELKKDLNIESFLRKNNLETICITAIGSAPGEFDGLQAQYLTSMSEFLLAIAERFKKIWYHSDFIYSFSFLKRREEMLAAKVISLSNTLVQKRKSEMKIAVSKNQTEVNQGKQRPFLDLVLELTDKTGCFTDEEIREETDNVILGGHDTSASTLTFAFVLMGTYPQVQQKVYDEILEVVGNQSRDLGKEDIAQLVYTEAVLKETLRLYPIAPLVARKIDKEVKLENYTLKVNAGCFLYVWGMHRSLKWGSDAEQFRPERWLEPNVPAHIFGGFGLGRRSCIGKVYALMAMKTLVAHVIRRYRITADASKLKMDITAMLRPIAGHHVLLELR